MKQSFFYCHSRKRICYSSGQQPLSKDLLNFIALDQIFNLNKCRLNNLFILQQDPHARNELLKSIKDFVIDKILPRFLLKIHQIAHGIANLCNKFPTTFFFKTIVFEGAQDSNSTKFCLRIMLSYNELFII